MGVTFDVKNDEVWVANYGDHTALVFARNASGDAAPKRIVRNAPAGSPTVGFGNPGAVAYDSKRDETAGAQLSQRAEDLGVCQVGNRECETDSSHFRPDDARQPDDARHLL